LIARLRADARIFPVLVVLVAVLGVTAAGNATFMQSATYVAIYAIAAIGLSLLLGNVDQISLGQAGFFAIGAYSAGTLTAQNNWPFWPAALVGIALSAIVGLAVGFIALRLRGHYLAMATLSFGLMAVGAIHAAPWFGGSVGIADIPYPTIGALTLTGPAAYWFAWTVALLAGAGSLVMLRGPIGYRFEAIRCDTLAAEMIGIPTRRYKIGAFVLAGALAGCAGAIYATFLGLVVPDALGVALSIDLLLMVVLGGAGSVSGAIVGAALIGYINVAGHQYQNWREVVYGILVVVVVVGAPGGLVGLLRRLPGRTVNPAAPAAAESRVAPAQAANAERTSDVASSGASPLSVAGLTRRFGGLVAVNDVSFALERGSLTSLIGPNGAGKTTLFNCISGMGRPDAGTVTIGGVDVTGWQPSRIIARGIGRTFQNTRLFGEMTVLENVTAAALRRDAQRTAITRAGETLERLGLTHLAGVRASDLPFGDRRRIELARAIVTDPWLLLVDEPAAGLNEQERALLCDDLLRLRAQGVTLLLIEHDMNLVMSISDRVMVLEFGRLIADGPPAVVRSAPAVVEAYLGTAS
jgi:branched-chain amino acid transport system permease protein